MDDVMRRVAALPEGSLTAIFLGADSRVVLQVDFSEGTAYVDELFLRHVEMLVYDVGLPAVRLLVARAAGRPTRIDRLLWRELSTRLAPSPTELVDLTVVGDRSWWSAATNRVTTLSDAA